MLKTMRKLRKGRFGQRTRQMIMADDREKKDARITFRCSYAFLREIEKYRQECHPSLSSVVIDLIEFGMLALLEKEDGGHEPLPSSDLDVIDDLLEELVRLEEKSDPASQTGIASVDQEDTHSPHPK